MFIAMREICRETAPELARLLSERFHAEGDTFAGNDPFGVHGPIRPVSNSLDSSASASRILPVPSPEVLSITDRVKKYLDPIGHILTELVPHLRLKM